MDNLVALTVAHSHHGSVSHIGPMHAHNGSQNEGMLSVISDKLSDSLVVDHSTGMIHSEIDTLTVLVQAPTEKL